MNQHPKVSNFELSQLKYERPNVAVLRADIFPWLEYLAMTLGKTPFGTTPEFACTSSFAIALRRLAQL